VSWTIPDLRAMTTFPGAVRVHAEAKLALHRRGWISLQNTIAGYTNYSCQPRESYLGLVNQDVYNTLCSSIIINSGWSAYKVVFVRSNGTDYPYTLSGPASTWPYDVPVHEP
jgi:hypothetical protein